MTINLKNFLTPNKKISKMGEFQEIKHIEGLQVSSVSADLYKNGRDDISLFILKKEQIMLCHIRQVPLFQSL